MPEVVFTTAYEQYAIKAFELHALDYLLKPFDQSRFSDTMKHAKERLRNRQLEDGRSQIRALLDNVKRRPRYLDRLIIKSEGRITFLKTDDIDWIEGDDKYVHLHTRTRAQMVRQTLSAMEAQLDPGKFLRIHCSAIINIERVQELQPMFGGQHVVVMEDGTRLTLSRNYKDKLFKVLGGRFNSPSSECDPCESVKSVSSAVDLIVALQTADDADPADSHGYYKSFPFDKPTAPAFYLSLDSISRLESSTDNTSMVHTYAITASPSISPRRAISPPSIPGWSSGLNRPRMTRIGRIDADTGTTFALLLRSSCIERSFRCESTTRLFLSAT